jgi:para-aminobenzoate synthetase component 1
VRAPDIDSFVPEIRELPADCTLESAWERLAHLPHGLLLDSSLPDPKLGRYSYLTGSPVEWHSFGIQPSAPFGELPKVLARHRTGRVSGLPPFQGGLAGLLTYEFGNNFERLPQPAFSPFQLPAVAFGLYDWVLSWDRASNRGWLVSQGLPETELGPRRSMAVRRADEVWELLFGPVREPAAAPSSTFPDRSVQFAPQYELPQLPGLTSNFNRDRYLTAVARAIDYIRAGDIFQVNLSQQLLLPATSGPQSLYRRLRRENSSTFASFFDLGEAQIISASPERLLAVDGTRLETRPIKGTRRRTGQPLVDLAAAEELLHSDKDRAENAMIVDLVRNDFSRVCTDESVEVEQFCKLERYRSVLHLVSSVTGELRPGLTGLDALAAMFPGGSVTGCPKIRAMEIITELEQTARGAYCGSIGYLGLDGQADFNLLIRTITASRGWWQFPVGGAIVVQSDAEQEYEETWVKAAGLLHACRETSISPPLPAGMRPQSVG